MAGLPPSRNGKGYLFIGALSAKFYGLASIAVLNSALACAYYLRMPAAMLFQASPTMEPVKVSVFSAFASTFWLAAVVGLGIYHEPFVEVCEAVASVMVR